MSLTIVRRIETNVPLLTLIEEDETSNGDALGSERAEQNGKDVGANVRKAAVRKSRKEEEAEES